MQYGLVEEMRELVNHLEVQLTRLSQTISEYPLLAASVFELPAPLKGDELSSISTIPVTTHQGEHARQLAIAHYCRLFMQQQSENISTRSAVRLPGAICLRTTAEQRKSLQLLINQINQSKEAFAELITQRSGLPPEARFEFVHQHFPGLITLNAYRHVSLIADASSVNFGWANKHVMQNVTRQAIIDKLERSLKAGRSRAPWTKQQWAEKVQQELDLIRQLPEDGQLKIKRPVKVQPVARVWNAATQKQRQLACPNPLLITCEPKMTVPILGTLNDYDENMITHRHIPNAIPMQLIIPRLWLWYQA